MANSLWHHPLSWSRCSGGDTNLPLAASNSWQVLVPENMEPGHCRAQGKVCSIRGGKGTSGWKQRRDSENVRKEIKPL